MANDRNTVDLINAPVDIAVKAAQEQLDAFQRQFTQNTQIPNPVRDYMHSLGVRVQDLKRK